jgi:two-component system sensor histidine kinase AtoS
MDKTTYFTDNSLELSKMFHEIKNPLTLISSSLQLIENEHPEVRDFRFWKQTRKDLSLLCDLINDLSAYQKGRLLNSTLIHLFDFLEDLSEATAAFLCEGAHPLLLVQEISDLDFYCDSIKLRHAMVNLIKNAAESSPHGAPVTLQVSVQNQCLCFCIKDRGCGISDKQLAHLYEPFYTTKPYGTGLGLSISQRIVMAHSGTMEITSAPEEGTRVLVSLPLTNPSELT